MIKTLTYFTLIMLVGATLSAAPVEKVPLKDVRNVISQQEFLQAGLSKLSEQELRELNGALYGWKEIANVEAIAVSVKSEASGGPSSTVTRAPGAVIREGKYRASSGEVQSQGCFKFQEGCFYDYFSDQG